MDKRPKVVEVRYTEASSPGNPTEMEIIFIKKLDEQIAFLSLIYDGMAKHHRGGTLEHRLQHRTQ